MSDHHGTVWWNELNTRDPGAAVGYYGEILGWRFDSMEMPEGGLYHVGMKGEKPVAGIFDMRGDSFLDGIPPHWFTYFAVADIDATIAASRAAKGGVRRDPFDVPGVGRIAILEDPSGGVVGMMTPAPTEG